MNNLRLIIFDFGDTLVSLNPSKESIVSEFLSSKGLNVNLDDIIMAYRIIDHCYKQSALRLKKHEAKKEFLLNTNKQLLKIIGLSKNGDEWAKELFILFSQKKKWELFSDTLPALDKYKNMGYEMAVLANWDKDLRSLITKLGINKYFSYIYSSEELSIEKPDPEIFASLMKYIAITPEKALYVGNDYELDVLCARSAGIEPVLIDRSRFFPNADCLRYESLDELSEYIKKV